MNDEINQIQTRIRNIQDCIYSDAHTKKTRTSRPQNRDLSKSTHERLRAFNNSKGNYKSGPSTEDLMTFNEADDSSSPSWENFGPNVFANIPSTLRANGFPTSNTNAMNISTPDNNPYNPPMFNANNFTTPNAGANPSNNATNTNLPPVDLTEFDPFAGAITSNNN